MLLATMRTCEVQSAKCKVQSAKCKVQSAPKMRQMRPKRPIAHRDASRRYAVAW